MADDDYAPEALEDGDNEDKDDFKVGGLSGNHTTTRFARRFSAVAAFARARVYPHPAPCCCAISCSTSPQSMLLSR
jgi:hypothetical protein